MHKYPPLPFPDAAMTYLIDNWVKDYPAIKKVSICRGRKPIKYVLLFKPDLNADPSELTKLEEWIDFQALSDGALYDIKVECNLNKVNFNLDDWSCWIGDDKPNEFINRNTCRQLFDKDSEIANSKANLSIASKILSDHFPALKYEPLKVRAKRWVELYYKDVPITSVKLFNYNSKFAYAFAEKQNGDQDNQQLPTYAIVFDIDADDETQAMSADEAKEHNKKKVQGLIPEMPWDKLLRDIHYNETATDRRYPQLLQPDFKNVYKDPPSMVPYREWYFAAKFRNTALQGSVRIEELETIVVLYPSIPTENERCYYVEDSITDNDQTDKPLCKIREPFIKLLRLRFDDNNRQMIERFTEEKQRQNARGLLISSKTVTAMHKVLETELKNSATVIVKTAIDIINQKDLVPVKNELQDLCTEALSQRKDEIQALYLSHIRTIEQGLQNKAMLEPYMSLEDSYSLQQEEMHINLSYELQGKFANQTKKPSTCHPTPKPLKGTVPPTSRKHKRPDYQYWEAQAYWDLKEASCLLYDCDPEYFKKLPLNPSRPSDLHKKIWSKEKLVKRSYEVGELKRHPKTPPGTTCFEPREFIEWAMNKPINVPDELKEMRNRLEADIEAEIAFGDSGFMPIKKLITKSQSKEWLAERTVWAIKNGVIEAAELVCIMANDESYNLPNLWQEFQMHIKGDNCPDTSKIESKVDILVALFNRWTSNTILDIDPSYKGKYKFDNIWKPLKVHRQSDDSISVELDKLKKFFVQWEIPLPKALFPKHLNTSASPVGWKAEIEQYAEKRWQDKNPLVAYDFNEDKCSDQRIRAISNGYDVKLGTLRKHVQKIGRLKPSPRGPKPKNKQSGT